MSPALVDRVATALAGRTSRRGFLARAAVVGSAIVAAPAAYILRPQSAYAAICGAGSTCDSGWTVFCCTVNDGINRCPPGSLVAGWWKADSSAFCCGPDGSRGPRYYIDCNAECSGCSDGCGSFCSDRCHGYRCRCGDPDTCDQRLVACNHFRYGQCHQEVGCVGPVVCRMVTCTPPWELYAACGSTDATDNNTASHSAPCLAPPCA